MDENIHFFTPTYFPIFQDEGPKSIKKQLPTLPADFEVEKNVFIDENIHFFTRTYFLIFQDGGPKNLNLRKQHISY